MTRGPHRGTSTLIGVCAAALVLAGCGFQLRTWDLSVAFETARIDAERGVDLDRDLAQALTSAGVRLVDRDADVVVGLSGQRDEWRSISVTSGARTAEYELALEIAFTITGPDGEVLAEQRVLRSERVARLDRDNLVGSSEERALLAAEVRGDLVGRMVRTLEALSKRTGSVADPG